MSQPGGGRAIGWAVGALALLATPAASQSSHEYRVGPGDVLEVEVARHPELSCAPAVGADGSIRLVDGHELPVSELTVGEIAGRVAEHLRHTRAEGSEVRVSVADYRSRFVRVEGAVHRPGRVPLRGGTRLIDALVEAGGLTPEASGELVILRAPEPGQETHRRIEVRVTPELEARGRVDLALPLEHRDRIAVLPRQAIAVGGKVRRPGVFPLHEAPTLLAALAAAGGTDRFSGEEVELKRQQGGTEKIDLEAVRRGERPDPVLAGGDVVSVR